MPQQKSRAVIHPFNVMCPQNVHADGPLVDLPDNFHEYKYAGPAVDMLPREVTPGVDRRPGVVGRFEHEYQQGDVTVKEELHASLAEVKAHHDRIAKTNPEAAHKVALLGDQAAAGLSNYYKKSIAPAQQEKVITANNPLVNQKGEYQSLAQQDNAHLASMAHGKVGHDMLFARLNGMHAP